MRLSCVLHKPTVFPCMCPLVASISYRKPCTKVNERARLSCVLNTPPANGREGDWIELYRDSYVSFIYKAQQVDY